MAPEPVEDRYTKKQKKARLAELARRGMSTDEIEAEEAVLKKAKEQRKKDPQKYQLKADGEVGRNDPCPCGSGKKYKKCCGKGK